MLERNNSYNKQGRNLKYLQYLSFLVRLKLLLLNNQFSFIKIIYYTII